MRTHKPLAAAVLVMAAGFASAQNTVAETLADSAPGSAPLTICLDAAPPGLDPARGPAGSAPSLLTRQMFDTLVEFAKDGHTIKPGLAHSWEVSTDGLTYIFHLRDGVAFHQTDTFEPTRQFGPNDVKFTFTRLLDPKHPLRPGGTPNLQAGGMNPATIIETIKKTGDNKVRFTLKAANSGFLSLLAMDFAGIQSAEYATRLYLAGQPWMLDTHPVGTGPFKATSIGKSGAAIPGPPPKPEFEIVEQEGKAYIRVLASIPQLDELKTKAALGQIGFSAHASHWRGRPASDELRTITEPKLLERYGHFAGGACQIMPAPAQVDLESLRRNPETRLVETPGEETLYLAFNTKNAPFDDQWVRRAFAEAVNVEALSQLDGLGGTPAANIHRNADHAFTDNRRIYNVAVARAHLAGAKVENPKLRLLVPVATSDGPAPVADFLSHAWSSLGADVIVIKKPWSDLIPSLQSGDYDAALLAWRAESADLAFTYHALLSCGTVGASNASHWCDRSFDESIGAVHASTSPEMRQEALAQAARMVISQLPIVPLVHLTKRWAVRANVDGLGADAPVTADLTKVWIRRPIPLPDADIDPESGEDMNEESSG